MTDTEYKPDTEYKRAHAAGYAAWDGQPGTPYPPDEYRLTANARAGWYDGYAAAAKDAAARKGTA